jgi:hypothetical protein
MMLKGDLMFMMRNIADENNLIYRNYEEYLALQVYEFFIDDFVIEVNLRNNVFRVREDTIFNPFVGESCYDLTGQTILRYLKIAIMERALTKNEKR